MKNNKAIQHAEPEDKKHSPANMNGDRDKIKNNKKYKQLIESTLTKNRLH